MTIVFVRNDSFVIHDRRAGKKLIRIKFLKRTRRLLKDDGGDDDVDG